MEEGTEGSSLIVLINTNPQLKGVGWRNHLTLKRNADIRRL
jgi:hypothetical protein